MSAEYNLPIEITYLIISETPWRTRPLLRQVCQSWKELLDKIVDARWWKIENVNVHYVRSCSLLSIKWVEEHTKFISDTIDVLLNCEALWDKEVLIFLLHLKLKHGKNVDIKTIKTFHLYAMNNCDLELLDTFRKIYPDNYKNSEEYIRHEYRYANFAPDQNIISRHKSMKGAAEKIWFFVKHIPNCESRLLGFSGYNLNLMMELEKCFDEWDKIVKQCAQPSMFGELDVCKYIFSKLDRANIIDMATSSYMVPWFFKSENHAIWFYKNIVTSVSEDKLEMGLIQFLVEGICDTTGDVTNYLQMIRPPIEKFFKKKWLFNSAYKSPQVIDWLLEVKQFSKDILIKCMQESNNAHPNVYQYLVNKYESLKFIPSIRPNNVIGRDCASLDFLKWKQETFPDEVIYLHRDLFTRKNIPALKGLISKSPLALLSVPEHLWLLIRDFSFELLDFIWSVWQTLLKTPNLRELFCGTIIDISILSKLRTGVILLSWIHDRFPDTRPKKIRGDSLLLNPECAFEYWLRATYEIEPAPKSDH